MAVAINVTQVDAIGNNVVYVFGTLTFSGSYAAGGDTIDFTKATGVPFPSAQPPIQAYAQDQKPGAVSGWLFSVSPGSAQNNSLVQIFGQNPTSTTAGVIALQELAAGAYPASVTGASVVFEAIFPKLQ